jgi:hypothetical protein
MNRSRAVGFDLREGLFFDGRYDNLIPLSASSIEHEKRKSAIARDESKFFSPLSHRSPV